jgi:hypothetical protein
MEVCKEIKLVDISYSSSPQTERARQNKSLIVLQVVLAIHQGKWNELASYSSFSDETWFHQSGYVNNQDSRIWSSENPQLLHEVPMHPEKLGVWCALRSSILPLGQGLPETGRLS